VSKSHQSKSEEHPNRREFLSTAAGIASVSLAYPAVTRAKPRAKVTHRPLGANDRINLGFIGGGMQFHGLLNRAFTRRKEEENDFEYAALCDVWQPRLTFASEATGCNKLYRDYREMLTLSDIDGVVIVAPDHWHFPMAKDACEAGKDVYLEKPVTYTLEEAERLIGIVKETGSVLQVGGSGPAEKLNWKINKYLKSGKIGKIVWALTSYNRNTETSMWNYPIPGLGSRHWPEAEVTPGGNLDWNSWLGPAPKRPFSADRYFRWRKYWDYSDGNASDLLYHRLGTLLTMLGFDFPTRVSGMGGIYVQKDREVPDTYMTMVEYPGDYTINMVSTMANSTATPLAVYANWGTLEVLSSTTQFGDSMGDPTQSDGPQRPRIYAKVIPEQTFLDAFKAANDGKEEVIIDSELGTDLVDDWLNCMRTRDKPVYDVLMGYQTMVAINLGIESYREGRVMAFDPENRQVIYPPKRAEYPPEEV